MPDVARDLVLECARDVVARRFDALEGRSGATILAEDFERAVAEYGKHGATIAMPPPGREWTFTDVHRIGDGHWKVDFDFWTTGGERGDLTLKLELWLTPHGTAVARVLDLRVL